MKRLDIDDVFECVAKKFDNTTVTDVQRIYEFVMKQVLVNINLRKSFRIPFFGRFYMSRHKVARKFYRIKKKFLNGTIDEAQYRKRIAWWWERYRAAVRHDPGIGTAYRLAKKRNNDANAEIIAHPDWEYWTKPGFEGSKTQR